MDELAGLLPAGAPLWLLDPAAGETLGWPDEAAATREGAVLIGPEGGFSPAEIDELGRRGARGARLGPRILRVETAAIAAAAILLGSSPP